MARARNIKPAFFTNDHLADVHPLGRLLFIGLWTIADREGRLEDRPRRIKAEVLPYDDVDCNNLLNQLVEHGFILRYSVDSKRFIQVLKFNKHQNPHVKEAASVIPAPDLTGASTVQEPEQHNENPADSLNPITDSLNLIPDTPTPEPRKRDSSAKPTDERFETWYSAYPKKVGKQKAKAAFQKINWREVDFDHMLAALEEHKQSEDWTKDNGKYIPHPTTYLNRGGWDDELTPLKPSVTEPKTYPPDPDEADRQLRRQLEEMRQQSQGGGESNVIPWRREA